MLAFEEAYGARAVAAWARVWSASNDLIRARFDLGKLVYAALQSGAYGDGVVVRLAARLSRESGKLVPSAILYEVAQLSMAFGGTVCARRSFARSLNVSVDRINVERSRGVAKMICPDKFLALRNQ